MEQNTPIPVPWEGKRVLRALWAELPAQAIGLRPLQRGSHEALVSADEPGDSPGGSALQCAGGAIIASAAHRRTAPTIRVPGVAVV